MGGPDPESLRAWRAVLSERAAHAGRWIAMTDPGSQRRTFDDRDADHGAVIPWPQVMPAGNASRTVDPLFDCGEDGECHLAEGAQGLVAVLPAPQVTLGERVEAGVTQRVDQNRDLDAVTGWQRQPLEQVPASCKF